MKTLILLSIAAQIIIRLWPSVKLSKGKWIRHKSTVRLPLTLGDSVDPMAAMPQIKIKGEYDETLSQRSKVRYHKRIQKG